MDTNVFVAASVNTSAGYNGRVKMHPWCIITAVLGTKQLVSRRLLIAMIDHYLIAS